MAKKYSVEIARSRLRDPANRSNTTFITKLLEEQVIDTSWNQPTPKFLGAAVSDKSSPVIVSLNLNAGRTSQTAVIGEKIKQIQVLPSYKYNPVLQGKITDNTKLSNNTTISKFFNTNPPTDFSIIKDVSTRMDVAKNLYLHSMIIKLVQESAFVGPGLSLIPTEGVYEPEESETVTEDSINYKKALGKAVVYKVVDSNGKESLSKTWELATTIKDIAYFDELILSYDTLEKAVKSRLIFVMPDKISDNWKATFRRKLSTEYNFNNLSPNELVEVTNYNNQVDLVDFQTGGSDWIKYRQGLSEFNRDILPELYSLLITIAQAFGQPLIITSGKRPKSSKAGVGSSSKHVTGEAVDIITDFNDAKTLQLIEIAAQAGVRGIGIYRTSNRGGNNSFNGIHLDIRKGAKAAWGNDSNKNNYSRAELYRYPWAHKVLRKYGFPTG